MKNVFIIICFTIMLMLYLVILRDDSGYLKADRPKIIPDAVEVKYIRFVKSDIDFRDKHRYNLDGYTLSNESDIHEFISALRDAEKKRPNHPTFIKRCDVIISTESTKQRIQLSQSPEGFVFFSYGGHHESVELAEILRKFEKGYEIAR